MKSDSRKCPKCEYEWKAVNLCEPPKKDAAEPSDRPVKSAAKKTEDGGEKAAK